jgi:hypothetical protein
MRTRSSNRPLVDIIGPGRIATPWARATSANWLALPPGRLTQSVRPPEGSSKRHPVVPSRSYAESLSSMIAMPHAERRRTDRGPR